MSKLDKYKIALIQMDCKYLDVIYNLEKVLKYIKIASYYGAKLICLPETFNTGYYGEEISQLVKYAEGIEGITLRTLKKAARDCKVSILAPILFKAADGIRNSAFFIDDDGSIVGVYSKTHLIGKEKLYLRRGTEYPVWDTKIGRIGCLICYDICFPETARMLMLKGVQMVLVPAAWRGSYYFTRWWDLNNACRALDNLIYIAGINRIGESGSEYFAGKTQLCSPIGEILSVCSENKEEILYGTVDLKKIEEERKFNTVLEDRHPEDYRNVIKITKESKNGM